MAQINSREGNEELSVIIETPQEVVWQGNAQAVSSKNSVGKFDILPEHANMVTLIDQQPIFIYTSGGDQKFTFKRAIISVNENKVAIYTDFTSYEEKENAGRNIDKTT